MKKLLILGGGHADIPLIQAGKALGYYVYTSGNKSEDLGHAYGDEYAPVDFSDIHACLKLAQDLKIDAICAACNDFSALSAAYVAEKMGLAGHDSLETSEVIHHKDAYRAFAKQNGIKTPDATVIRSASVQPLDVAHLTFPLIVKPVDLTGGKGIQKVLNFEELVVAVKAAFAITRQNRIVIEEFLEGTRHGFTALIKNKKVVFHFSDNEHYFLNQYMVSAASTPANLRENAIEELIKQSEKIANKLNLVDGIFHVQFIMHDHYPTIIEICRRSPGDLYIRLVEIATGVPYPELILRNAIGLPVNTPIEVKNDGYYLRHCIMSHETGEVNEVIFDESILPNIVEQFIWGKVSDEVNDVMTYKYGIIFMRFSNLDEMIEKSENMQSLIKIKTSSSKKGLHNAA